jgi:hypothetical protein
MQISIVIHYSILQKRLETRVRLNVPYAMTFELLICREEEGSCRAGKAMQAEPQNSPMTHTMTPMLTTDDAAMQRVA